MVSPQVLESTILSAARLSDLGPAMAGHQTAAAASKTSRESPAACRTRTTTPKESTASKSRILNRVQRFRSRVPAHYCGDDCRNAVRRVVDRERKYRCRKTSRRRIGRRGKSFLGGTRCQPPAAMTPARAASQDPTTAADPTSHVRNYRDGPPETLSCHTQEDIHHAPETNLDRRPRASPSP